MCPSNDNVKTSESVKSLRFRDWTKGTRGGELPLQNEFPAFWTLLGILENLTMQISLHQISLEFSRIFGNGKLGLTLDMEFLGILSFTILEA